MRKTAAPAPGWYCASATPISIGTITINAVNGAKTGSDSSVRKRPVASTLAP